MLLKLTAATSSGQFTTREATFDGRPHLVVPVVALVEGVLHAMNSTTPEMVLAEEFTRPAVVGGFNGRPLYHGHPLVNGEPVSGNDPQILENLCIGRVFNTATKNNKLVMEAWIDLARCAAIAPDLLERVKTAQDIEISVGVFCESDESEAGEHNGRQYAGAWRDIVPDHLALLVDGDRGACSRTMGCGVRAARDISQDERDKMPEADFAGPDRSFPIAEPVDVHDAAQSLGRAKGDHDAIKAKIIAIAHRKGAAFVAQLPEAWDMKSAIGNGNNQYKHDNPTGNQLGKVMGMGTENGKVFSVSATDAQHPEVTHSFSKNTSIEKDAKGNDHVVIDHNSGWNHSGSSIEHHDEEGNTHHEHLSGQGKATKSAARQLDKVKAEHMSDNHRMTNIKDLSEPVDAIGNGNNQYRHDAGEATKKADAASSHANAHEAVTNQVRADRHSDAAVAHAKAADAHAAAAEHSKTATARDYHTHMAGAHRESADNHVKASGIYGSIKDAIGNGNNQYKHDAAAHAAAQVAHEKAANAHDDARSVHASPAHLEEFGNEAAHADSSKAAKLSNKADTASKSTGEHNTMAGSDQARVYADKAAKAAEKGDHHEAMRYHEAAANAHRDAANYHKYQKNFKPRGAGMTKDRTKAGLFARIMNAFRAEQAPEEMSDTDLRRNLLDALRDEDPTVNYIEAFYPATSSVVYACYSPMMSPSCPDSNIMMPQAPCLYRRSYTVGDNGVVTLGDDTMEVEPILTYQAVPAEEAPTTAQGAPCKCQDDHKDTRSAIDMTKEQITKFLETATDEQVKALSAVAEPPAPAATEAPTPAVASAAPTFEEVLASAEPSVRDAITVGRAAGDEKRATTIKALKETGRCDLSDQELASMTQSQLDGLVKLAGSAKTDFSAAGGSRPQGQAETIPAAPDMVDAIRAARGTK